MTNEPDRVMIFIDGSNFYHGLKNDIGGVDIDFNKFAELLAGNRELIGVHYYNAPLDSKMDPERYKKQQQFFERLKKIPNFNLVLVRLQKRKLDGKIYYAVKGDDIHIAVDMIMQAQSNSYDTAVLVSGDGDFVPAVKAVQAFGKHIENYYFKTGHSWHLKQVCNKSVLMSKELIEKCTKH